MKYQTSLISLSAALLLGFSSTVTAATDDVTENKAVEAQVQARLEVEYEKALTVAESSQTYRHSVK